MLHLSAHNSLTPRGFVIFIGVTFALILVPLIAVIGSPVLWALLPFVLGALAAIWWALKRSWADKDVSETLTLWTDRTELQHRPGRGAAKDWAANTYWITVHMHPRRGRHRHYITLTGARDAREVELGSFLSEDERRDLFPVLRATLDRVASSSLPT